MGTDISIILTRDYLFRFYLYMLICPPSTENTIFSFIQTLEQFPNAGYYSA